MNTLEQARVAFDVARDRYRDALAAELAALGVGGVEEPPAPAVKKAAPAPTRKTAKKIGTETCKACGRRELFKAMGPGQVGKLKFHYCPGALPCEGGSLSPATEDDLRAGTHKQGDCAKCSARVSFK